MRKFALVYSPAPLLNTSNIPGCWGGKEGNALAVDDQNLLRAIETILPAHSKVELLEQIPDSPLWKVRTCEYPFTGDFFLDERFVVPQSQEPPERLPRLPSLATILGRYRPLLGAKYIWGGNQPQGIAALKNLYPPRSCFHSLSQELRDLWILKGLDCSGLLHYLTDGYTPHRTSALMHIGRALPTEGKTEEELLALLRPLDILVWPGHVVIVAEEEKALESIHPQGVILTPFKTRLREAALKKGSQLTFRRWHPESI